MPLKNGVLYEHWHRVNDNLLQSKGFIVKASGDTMLLESVQIALKNGQLFYIPTVNGQNNNQPVEFVFTANDGHSFTAENPAHDFPQKIFYRLDADKNFMQKYPV